MELFRKGEEDVFLAERDLVVNNAQECYRKLAYQTAHIKYHYSEKLKEYTGVKVVASNKTGAVGISLGKEAIYGAVDMPNGDIGLIFPNESINKMITLTSDYKHPGFGSIWNPGVAISEMAFQIHEIAKSYETWYGDKVNKVFIAMPAFLPADEDVENTVEDLYHGDKGLNYDIYEAIGLHAKTSKAMLEKSVDLAEIDNAEYINRAIAIAAGYEHENMDNKLSEFAGALVYDWCDDYFSVTLVDGGGKDGNIRILNQIVIKNPLEDVEFKAALRASMEKILNEYFIFNDSDNDNIKKSMEIFYGQAKKVLKQMIRNNYATLLYEDYRINMVVDYPASVFEEIFSIYYQKTEDMVRKLFSEIGYPESDICRVFVSGEWGNYSYVTKQLQNYFGKYQKICIMDDTSLAAVKGAAYLAKKDSVSE